MGSRSQLQPIVDDLEVTSVDAASRDRKRKWVEMAYPKGAPRPPGSGRAKGTLNKATKAFQEAVDEILKSPDTHAAFLALRDSDDSTDRSNFWRLAGKRVATMIEANINGGITARIVDLSSERKDGIE